MKSAKVENALYVVATPIGNLGDITLRALDVLKSCDYVICEDTRVTSKLLGCYEIKDKKLITYNDNSSQHDRQKIENLLSQGKSLSLVSDAGTPLISDPGHKLINFLRQRNYKIIPIPGASSLTALLSSSGIACDNFLFLGFLPSSEIQKEKLLKSLPKNFTFVFFESPNRILETMNLMLNLLGNRNVAIGREITKIHEEILADSLQNLVNFLTENLQKLRGEFVVVVEKADKDEKDFTQDDLIDAINEALNSNQTIKDLSQNLAEIYNLNKKEIYKLALEITKNK